MPSNIKSRDEFLALEEKLRIQIEENESNLKLLKESDARFRLLTESVADVFWRVDCDYRFTYISPVDERLRGYKTDEVIGHHIYEFLNEDGITTIKKIARQRQEAEQLGIATETLTFEAQHLCKDGSWLWAEIRSMPDRDADGNIIGYHGITREITERKQAEALLKESTHKLIRQNDQLRASEEKHRILFDSAGDAIFIHNMEKILAVNPRACKRLGYTNEELLALPLEKVNTPEHTRLMPEKAAEVMAIGHLTLETVHLHKDGTEIPTELTASKVIWDGEPAILTICRDVTKRKLAEKLLEYNTRKFETMSNTDVLTGVANRRRFDEALAMEYARHARSGGELSLIMLDVDHFKAFNDCYGHVEGDYCLRKIAQVIADCSARSTDLAARYGGEEFACILPDTDINSAVAIAEKIRCGILALGIPHKGSKVAGYVTASLGVMTIKCIAKGSPVAAVFQADKMLYLAKSRGRNRVEYEATEKPPIPQ